MSVQVPTRYRNFNAISNDVEYEPPLKYYPGQPLGKNFDYKPYKPQVYWSNQQYNQYNQQNDLYNSVDSNNQYNAVPTQQQPQQEVRQLIVVYQG